jgi:hypothetical protein
MWIYTTQSVVVVVVIIIVVVLALALRVSGRAALRAPASAANVKNLFCFVTPVFVCSAWLHGGQPGCLSIM